MPIPFSSNCFANASEKYFSFLKTYIWSFKTWGGEEGRNLTWKNFLQVKCENVNFEFEKGINVIIIVKKSK